MEVSFSSVQTCAMSRMTNPMFIVFAVFHYFIFIFWRLLFPPTYYWKVLVAIYLYCQLKFAQGYFFWIGSRFLQFYHTLVKQRVLLNLRKVAWSGIRHSYRKDEYILKIADMCTSVGILCSLRAIVLSSNYRTVHIFSEHQGSDLLSIT